MIKDTCPKAGFFRRLFKADSHRWRYYNKSGGPLTFFCRACPCGAKQRRQAKTTGRWIPFSHPFKYGFEQELFERAVEEKVETLKI